MNKPEDDLARMAETIQQQADELASINALYSQLKKEEEVTQFYIDKFATANAELNAVSGALVDAEIVPVGNDGYKYAESIRLLTQELAKVKAENERLANSNKSLNQYYGGLLASANQLIERAKEFVEMCNWNNNWNNEFRGKAKQWLADAATKQRRRRSERRRCK